MRTSPILIALAASAEIAGAASVNIVNPGFEDDLALIQGGGGWSDAVPNGWSDPQGGDNTNFMETIGALRRTVSRTLVLTATSSGSSTRISGRPGQPTLPIRSR
jgi:hypothetical protein